ncbi:NAD-dependent deacylase [Geomicrobium sp. JCM 19039]|uniref:SIR2 family NAD-dependent protein deacylase n=1 Tax=Geomicrobium sp. JCM 19039 TaxID=1460636 RepID=UPI00045F3901|nr:NAD-dependent deacylase [Geomicrobium sp. JCM 19039]GAK12888.1 NAD-dependent protein deacetylase of SIR2 family [Geomicrobium sp. JCM 19039]
MIPTDVKRVAILTGAGMSTESGIPDFRSETGLWQSFRPEEVASVQALSNHPDVFQSFYRERMKKLETIEPHDGHRLINQLEEQGKLHMLATQNVDGLHQQAGNENVLELHGNIQTIRCHDCETSHDKGAFMQGDHCRVCGGMLRPNVVLFGEMLPQGVWGEAIQKIEEADCLIVIGTSMQVSPVNQLPGYARSYTIYINHESSDFPFDKWMEMSASEGMRQLMDRWA